MRLPRQLSLTAFTIVLWLATASGCLAAKTFGERQVALNSPDRELQVWVHLPAAASGSLPAWSLQFHGVELMANCELGLETVDYGELLKGAKSQVPRSKTHKGTIPVYFGKADHAEDNYCEQQFGFDATNGYHIVVRFRVFNDAVAFRYEVNHENDPRTITIAEERSTFNLRNNPRCYAQYLENYETSHEHNVSVVSASDLKKDSLLDMPLTLEWHDGTYAAITEAALRNYAGMSLKCEQSTATETVLTSALTPRPDKTKVVRPLSLQTPWRVVLVANRPGALLESQTIYCLNEPSVIKDMSWIKPGKITFHWWNGDVFDGKRGPASILSLETSKKYIDFCASNGIPTHSISSDENTSPWYVQSAKGVKPGPDTDVTRPRAEFDLPAIKQYADSKGIRLWTWVHQGALGPDLDKDFAAFERMGWKGMMVDFFDHDDQDSVEYSERILEAAARHHIMIHFHGVWKPTGRQRTYPNLMNHEGALNLEYLKWSDRCTPDHNVMMAWTRLIAGPMDYHLGGFRSVPRDKFKPRHIAPLVMGTRCHHLAMYVCFDNPNPMVADYPTAYLNQPGFDFLREVPTWWDETKVLGGRPGEALVTARRKGRQWYVGGMTGGRPRDLELPLTFLGRGQYSLRTWQDARDTDVDSNHLVTEEKAATHKDALKVHLAADGGFVAKLTPTR